MAKSKKQRKMDQRATLEARRLTPGKLVRLLLKSLAFALMVAVLLSLFQALGVPYTDTPWFPFVVMVPVYILAYPFLMSEFRPKRDT